MALHLLRSVPRICSRVHPTVVMRVECIMATHNTLNGLSLCRDWRSQRHITTIPGSWQGKKRTIRPRQVMNFDKPRPERPQEISDRALVLETIQEYLESTHSTGNVFSVQELRDSLDSKNLVSAARWPSQVVNAMLYVDDSYEPLKLACAVYDHVKSESLAVTPIMLVSLLDLYSHDPVKHKDKINQLHDEILTLTGGLLDSTLGSIMIRAMSRTERWQECYKLLDMVALSATPDAVQYSHMVQGRFQAADYDEGWKLLHTMVDLGMAPKEYVFDTLVQSSGFSLEHLEKMMEMMEKHQWFPGPVLALYIKKFYEQQPGAEWKGEFTEIKSRHRGTCPVCNTQLKPLRALTSAEFKRLREEFLVKSFQRDDVFKNTTPQELEEFKSFLEEYGPFDMVLDGMNVAYKGRQSASPKLRIERLLTTIDELLQGEYKNRKILLVTRGHTQSWSKYHWREIKQKAYTFFANSLTADDPFILYAALHSGPDSYYVSGDEMRDHRFLLGQETAELFKQWQRGRQVMPMGTTSDSWNQVKMFLLWPKRHETRLQRTSKSLHIPVADEVRSSYDLPEKWLCLHNGAIQIRENKRAAAHDSITTAKSMPPNSGYTKYNHKRSSIMDEEDIPTRRYVNVRDLFEK